MSEKRKTLMLVDTQNLYYSLRDLCGVESRLDFLKLREIACRRSKCTSIDGTIYLTSIKEDLSALVDFLVYNGFNVKELKFKSDIDTQMVVDAVNMADEYKSVVICSGDSDFYPLIIDLKEKGKEVGVISFEQTSSKKSEQLADWVIHLDSRIILSNEQKGGTVNASKD